MTPEAIRRYDVSISLSFRHEVHTYFAVSIYFIQVFDFDHRLEERLLHDVHGASKPISLTCFSKYRLDIEMQRRNLLSRPVPS